MNNSEITHIQGLEAKLGLKVTPDRDLMKMTKESVESYRKYLESSYEAEVKPVLN